MRLNKIEEFRNQSQAKSCDLCVTLEEKMECGFMALKKLRSDVVRVALMGTRGYHGRRIAEIVDRYKEVHEVMTEFVDAVEEDAIDDVELHMKLPKEREVARGKLFGFRLKKTRPVLKPDRNDGTLFRIAKAHDEWIAELDRGQELMEKQCALIILAQDTMAWDSQRFFLYHGEIQGMLWTNGFKDEHFTKLASGMWSVRMRWTAKKGSVWRPGIVCVDRRFGRHDKAKVEWVRMKPALIVSGLDDVEFDVDIRVQDELFYEEEMEDLV